MRFSAPDPFATPRPRAIDHSHCLSSPYPGLQPYYPPLVPGSIRAAQAAAYAATQDALFDEPWWTPYFEAVTEGDRVALRPKAPVVVVVPHPSVAAFWRCVAFCAAVWAVLRVGPWQTLRAIVLAVRWALWALHYPIATALAALDAACVWVVASDAAIPTSISDTDSTDSRSTASLAPSDSASHTTTNWGTIHEWVQTCAIPSANAANERREIVRRAREEARERKMEHKAALKANAEWRAWMLVPSWKQKLALAAMSVYTAVAEIA